jgi:hypothetical protein
MNENNHIMESGLKAAGYDGLRVNDAAKHRKFRKLYGLEPETVRDLFIDIQTDIVGEKKLVRSQLKSLFVAIYWMKLYGTEDNIMDVFGIQSRVTLRKHVRTCLDALQALCQAKVCFQKKIMLICFDSVSLNFLKLIYI